MTVEESLILSALTAKSDHQATLAPEYIAEVRRGEVVVVLGTLPYSIRRSTSGNASANRLSLP